MSSFIFDHDSYTQLLQEIGGFDELMQQRREEFEAAVRALPAGVPVVSIAMPRSRGAEQRPVAFSSDGAVITHGQYLAYARRQLASNGSLRKVLERAYEQVTGTTFESAVELRLAEMLADAPTLDDDAAAELAASGVASDFVSAMDSAAVKELARAADSPMLSSFVLFERAGLHPSLPQATLGSVGTVKSENVHLPCGLTAVIGPAGVGKTPFAIACGLDSGRFGHIRFGEPLSGYATEQLEAYGKLVAYACKTQVVVFDSFKDLLGGDGLMKGGISREAMAHITALSSLMSNMMVALVVPFNPTTSDRDAVDSLRASLRSSTAGVAEPEGQIWAITRRRGEGLNRVTTRTRLDFDEGGVPRLTLVDAGYGAGSKDSISVDVELRDVNVSDAIRRYLG